MYVPSTVKPTAEESCVAALQPTAVGSTQLPADPTYQPAAFHDMSGMVPCQLPPFACWRIDNVGS